MGPRPKIGGRGASILADAVAGFASASTLLRNARFDDDEAPSSGQSLGLADKHNLSKPSTAAFKAEKPKVQLEKAPVFRKPPTLEPYQPVQEAVTESIDEAATALPVKPETSDVLPPKKAHKKKSKDEGDAQSKIKKPRITKPGAAKDITKTKKWGATKKPKIDRSPEHLLSDAVAKVAKKRATLAPEEIGDLGLEEAARRRADWTPVRDTAETTLDESSNLTDAPWTETPDTITLPKARFGSLHGDYGFAEQNGNVANDMGASRMTLDGVVIKKRKIELVNGIPGIPSAVEKVKRTKSPKKKLQTITAKATAVFAIASEAEAARSLDEYFMPPPNINSITKPKRQRSPAKTTKQKPKARKADTSVIVLSPETAMKVTRNQDFVFGTSSQLARGDSPTYIRDYQQAMKESELTALHLMDGPVSSLPLILSRSNSIALTPSRNLWSAATRNSDGLLLDAEFENLADTPRPEKPATKTSFQEKKTSESSGPETNRQDALHDTGDSSSPSKRAMLEPPPVMKQEDAEADKSLPRSVAEGVLKARPRSVSPTKKAVATKAHADQMPNFKGFTEAQLKKAIKSYGFKAISKLEKMIDMLEKCWESQRKQALQELPTNALLQQPSADIPMNAVKSNSPAKKKGRPPKAAATGTGEDKPSEAPAKKPRGRPKKAPSATTPPVKRKRKASVTEPKETTVDQEDEIYDSAPPTPSPPRRRTPSKAAKALTLSPTSKNPPTNSPSVSRDTPEGRARLLAAMSQAIAAQSPTHDPKNPSWREKMLMYEPVVIEDLTKWLNTDGLSKVDEDDEVWTTLVKEWCESRSVCCLWKENLRGVPRVRW